MNSISKFAVKYSVGLYSAMWSTIFTYALYRTYTKKCALLKNDFESSYDKNKGILNDSRWIIDMLKQEDWYNCVKKYGVEEKECENICVKN